MHLTTVCLVRTIMAASKHTPWTPDDDDDVVEVYNSTQIDRIHQSRNHSDKLCLCFAPSGQPHNHGSDRARPLRTMPFNFEQSGVWLGNLDDLTERIWPHPSYSELIARAKTSDPRFAIPDTVAKDIRFQSLRLQCCGSHDFEDPFVENEKPSRLEMLSFNDTQNVRYSQLDICVCRSNIKSGHHLPISCPYFSREGGEETFRNCPSRSERVALLDGCWWLP